MNATNEFRGRPLWLPLTLFLVTFYTATVMGVQMMRSFSAGLPPFQIEDDLLVFLDTIRHPSALIEGLPYSLALIAILLAHELGHYFACRFYDVRCTLPYFLPAPTFIGTFGAFIRFRSALKSRRELFDIGIAGPLAGFLFVIPVLGVGLALSKVAPGVASGGDLKLGTPLLMRALEMWLFPGTPVTDIYLHPVARAAWVGLLATALNLLPVGQLDGGHIVYAAFGETHRKIALATLLLLIPLGFIYWPWFLWAVIIFFLGRNHFAVFDNTPIGPGRRKLFLVAAIIFVLSFIPVLVQVQ